MPSTTRASYLRSRIDITRPALANERVQCNTAGQVVLEFKIPWRDGTAHLAMSPPEFMQRSTLVAPG